MLKAKEIFDESYKRVQNMHALYKYLLDDQHFQPAVLSDMLRSEIAFIVSAFDKFIHDVVKIGILEIFNGTRVNTASFDSYPINMSQMHSIISPSPTSDPTSILENIIVANQKHLSYQDPDKIAQALSLVWTEEHKWQKIATEMATDQKPLKIELKNIVLRRNQIVHEADIDLFTNDLQTINEVDVVKSVDFIKNLTDSIYNLIK